MFLCCRWCHVSAWQRSSNWFHTCLYHIINESTRRKAAETSDRLTSAARHRRETLREICNFFPPWPLFLLKWRSDFFLGFYFQDCYPSAISVTLWKRQDVPIVFPPILLNNLLPLPQSFFVLDKDFLPVSLPDTTISPGQIVKTIKSSLWSGANGWGRGGVGGCRMYRALAPFVIWLVLLCAPSNFYCVPGDVNHYKLQTLKLTPFWLRLMGYFSPLQNHLCKLGK